MKIKNAFSAIKNAFSSSVLVIGLTLAAFASFPAAHAADVNTTRWYRWGNVLTNSLTRNFNVLSNQATSITGTNNAIERFSGEEGIALSFSLTNAGAATSNVLFNIGLSIDGTNYSWSGNPSNGLTATWALNGNTESIGYVEFPPTVLGNAKFVKVNRVLVSTIWTNTADIRWLRWGVFRP